MGTKHSERAKRLRIDERQLVLDDDPHERGGEAAGEECAAVTHPSRRDGPETFERVLTIPAWTRSPRVQQQEDRRDRHREEFGGLDRH